MSLEEELENLACRFIVNLPANELASIERIGFQVELAYVSLEAAREHANLHAISFACVVTGFT